MKRIAIFILTIIVSSSCFSQVEHIQVLIGNSDLEVSSYLDSLNRLKPNPDYNIKREVSVNGDLILQNLFPINDEPYYKCIGFIAQFNRFAGKELCVRQIITGTSKFAQSNLSFIKDNFKLISPNHWEKPLGSFLKITAIFLKDPVGNNYSIIYEMEKAK